MDLNNGLNPTELVGMTSPGTVSPATEVSTEIDESLYSRQLYVLGFEAMKKMSISNVLICGLRGLGAEIAKNVVLAGVKSVTLFDPEPTKIEDLSAQFFLREDDLGKPRAEVTAPRLAELNSYVPINTIDEGPLAIDQLRAFQVVVLTDANISLQMDINDLTHKNNIYFISACTFGLFGQVFNDFGTDFEIIDPDGENPITGLIADIESDGSVYVLEDSRHGLEDGDYVTFSEVEGLEELNSMKPIKVQVKGPYSFSIVDFPKFEGSYKKGGIFTQVKMPKKVSFASMRESIKNPEFLITDFAKMDRPGQLHLGIQALNVFAETNDNTLPKPRDEEDAKKFMDILHSLKGELDFKGEIDEEVLKELCFQATGQISPVISVIGSIAAQEVLKAISGKFTPIHQYLYFDSLESLPNKKLLTKESCAPKNSRYDGQIAVMGDAFQELASKYKLFLVGAGAIGCEMLKLWSLMGVATSGNDQVYVTDMDTIEKSNLNRQFLFRPKDVGRLKSEVAAEKVKEMNPKMHIKALAEKVDQQSERVFNDDFFQNLDCIVTALDNVSAREYMDRRCVFFEKPIIDSGTLGTKGNSQVVVPYLTESYSSSHDPPEKSFPICTLKNFPNQIEHTIAWARDLFEGLFKQPADNVNMYLSQPNFISTLRSANNQMEILQSIESFLVTERPYNFDDCLLWARLEFEKHFSNNIKQLLHNFPPDATTSSGAPFWSGPKREPIWLNFDPSEPTHLNFVIAAANIHAFNYGLKGEGDPESIKRRVTYFEVPKFVPQEGVKIQVNDNEPITRENNNSSMDDQLETLARSLPSPDTLAGFRLHTAEFEKDDDTNFHIDFVTAASNLRAMNYGIKPVDRYKTKLIAGKIIPAIATTTSLVTGLVCLELYKIMNDVKKIEGFKNGFVNLALPFISFSEPVKSGLLEYNGKSKDKVWGRFDIDGNVTLQELIDKFKNEEKLTITMLSGGVSLLYASFFPPKKLKPRYSMTMTQLINEISQKSIDPEVKSLILEICAEDSKGEDVEVPYICVHLDRPKQKEAKRKTVAL